MNITDEITYLKRWAANQATDCDLTGANEEAFNFKLVASLLALVESQMVLIAKQDEIITRMSAELERLEGLQYRQ